MKIDISLNSIDEVRELLREFGRTPRSGADSPTGWVSHPIADLSKEPPSVMTVATTESAPAGGADLDIDKNFGEPSGDVDSADAYARAEAVAAFIIKNLLDFEAWLDERLFNDEEATVERVRFHAEIEHGGRSITMRHLTEYKNADRCKRPREDGRIMTWKLPDDDGLNDFEADVVGSCIQWVCNDLGIDVAEYLDKDGRLSGDDETDPECVTPYHKDDITDESIVKAADDEAAYVYRIVNGRLSALEAWVNSKVGKGGISVGVTVYGDTVIVRIAEQSDKECEPLMVRETRVRKGCDKQAYAERILNMAYNIVFGKFEELSYSEFIDHISAATDATRDADNEEYE